MLNYSLKISASPIYENILLQQILHNTTSEKKQGWDDFELTHREKGSAGDTNVWIDKRDSVIWKTSESENVRSVKKDNQNSGQCILLE